MKAILERLPILVLQPHTRCNCRCVMCDIWKVSEAREISLEDLQRHRAVIERLRELSEADFPRPDKDDPLHLRQAGKHRQACTGIPGRSTRHALGADNFCVSEGGRHPIVFKTAAGIEPLILEQQLAGFHVELPAEQVVLLEAGAAFADRDGRGSEGLPAATRRPRDLAGNDLEKVRRASPAVPPRA